MEDNRAGHQKLLVARSDKKCRKIYEEMQYVSENEEQNRRSSWKVETEQGTRETVNTSDGRLHYKVAVSSQKGCNPGSL